MAELSDESKLDDDDDAWASLNRWERGLALVLGVATGASGVLAVFLTNNQAGTAALLIVAAALLLMAVQGTPLTRFGSGDKVLAFARRRLSRELIAQAAAEPDTDRAVVFAQAATIASPAAKGYLRYLEYEERIGAALERLTGSQPNRPVGRNDNVDFRLLTGANLTAVVVKLRVTSWRQVEQTLEWIQKSTPEPTSALLVVSEITVSAMRTTRDRITRPGAQRSVELVVWHDPEDDEALQYALQRLGHLPERS